MHVLWISSNIAKSRNLVSEMKNRCMGYKREENLSTPNFISYDNKLGRKVIQELSLKH